MSVGRYFFVNELENEGFHMVPKVFSGYANYKSMTSDAKLYWSILFDLQKACYRKGWMDEETGRVYFYNPALFLKDILESSDVDIHEEILSELERLQLLEVEPTPYGNLKKYYLLKPLQQENALIHQDKLKLAYINKIKEYMQAKKEVASTTTEEVATSEVNNSMLLKKFLIEHCIDDEYLVSELYNKCIMTDQQLSYKKIKELYATIMEKKQVLDSTDSDEMKTIEYEEHALQTMNDYLGATEAKQLTESNKLVLYKHFEKIKRLKQYNKFSLSLILTKKTKHSLSSESFNYLLDEALDLYQLEEGNVLDFTMFFENVITHQDILDNKERLIEEIDTKLFSLPDHLKKFVYDQMKKYKDNFPNRYELILNNLRAINTIYEDFGSIPDSIFQKAFRRLFNDKEVYNISSYFKKGIGFIQKEMEKKMPNVAQPTEDPQIIDSKDWVHKVVSAKETEGAIEKMDENERAEYFRRGEELKNKLKRLKQGAE